MSSGVDYLEILRNRLENCLDYVGMGLGLSDLFRSSSVPFFSPLVVLLLFHLLFLGKDLHSLGIHTL